MDMATKNNKCLSDIQNAKETKCDVRDTSYETSIIEAEKGSFSFSTDKTPPLDQPAMKKHS